ncbi:MAG: hypothetical protein AAF467_02555 [Actinomycetota bacterium]
MTDRSTTLRRTVACTSLVGLLALTACSSAGEEAEPEPDPEPTPVESDSELPFGESEGADGGDDLLVDPDVPTPEAQAAAATPTADDVNRVLASETGLVELASVELLAIEIVEADVIVASFEMESHHCYGVTTTVRESEREVEIEVVRGRRATSAPGDCAHGAFPYAARFELDAPVGERTVVAAEPREPIDPGVTDEPGPSAAAEPAVAADATSSDDAASDDASGTESGGSQEWLLGLNVEDGVEWAIDHGLEWRVISFDGEPVDHDGETRPDRIAFVVERDLIVAYEWS